jgi:hypothetical protein
VASAWRIDLIKTSFAPLDIYFSTQSLTQLANFCLTGLNLPFFILPSGTGNPRYFSWKHWVSYFSTPWIAPCVASEHLSPNRMEQFCKLTSCPVASHNCQGWISLPRPVARCFQKTSSNHPQIEDARCPGHGGKYGALGETPSHSPVLSEWKAHQQQIGISMAKEDHLDVDHVMGWKGPINVHWSEPSIVQWLHTPSPLYPFTMKAQFC